MHNVEPPVFAVLIDPVLNLFHLDKVNLNLKAIEKKIGVFGEPMVIGMLIGIIGSIGHLDSLKTWGQIFYVAVSAGFAIPVGAALITSFNILGKPMLGLVFLAIPCSARHPQGEHAEPPRHRRSHKARGRDRCDRAPQSEELAALLARVHGVHSLADMGLDDSFYHKMAFLSPYVRQRLTFMRTLKFYDFYDEVTTP